MGLTGSSMGSRVTLAQKDLDLINQSGQASYLGMDSSGRTREARTERLGSPQVLRNFPRCLCLRRCRGQMVVGGL